MRVKVINQVKAIQKRLTFILLFIVCNILLCAFVRGLDRNRTITQFHHTAWTAKELAPGHIRSIAQTNDGYLWLGTATGLYRFDGVLFERFVPRAGNNLISNDIYNLLATPDGGLWISYFFGGGTSFLKEGILTNYADVDGLPAVQNFARDDEGNIWAAVTGGLARLEGASWRRIEAEWNYPGKTAQSVFVDREGTLWVVTEETVVFLPKGARSFQSTGERVGVVLNMSQSPDGSIWMAETGRSVRQVQLPGIDPHSLGPEIRIGSKGLLFDRDGALWATSLGDGIRRVPHTDRFRGQTIAQFSTDAEIFTENEGLSGNYIYTVFEDREGNIWIGTANGLDRFRESNIVPVRFPPGELNFGLAADAGGEVWAVSLSKGVNKIRGSTPTNIGIVRGTPFRDDEGTLWVVGDRGVFSFRGNNHSQIKKLNQPDSSLITIFRDRPGVLWIYASGEGIFRLRDDAWERFDRQSELPKRNPIVATVDSLDRKWFGYSNNVLTVIDGDNIKTFSPEDGLAVGNVKVIKERNGRIWVGGSLGTAILEGERFRMLIAEGSEGLNGVSGIVTASDGSLWLNESRGVVHIPAEDVGLFLENPLYKARYRIFDSQDGLLGTTQQVFPFPTAIEGTDGRLWFSTSKGVVWIDPRKISRNPVAPPVSIRSLTIDEKSFEPSSSLQLPKGTTRLRIDFTALSLSIPERVRFRFRLEGVDNVWLDAGTRRFAEYTNLGAGNYRFQVIASNNDGVWNEEGATLEFSIAPMFYQTTWFAVLCCVAVAGFVWLIYRWRVKHIKSRLHLQFEQRLDERTRIAQELHDTLLQSVFSASMQLDAANELLNESSQVKSKLNSVSELMGKVMEEGRGTIRSLHSASNNKTLVLEKAFAELKRDFDARGEIDFRVIVNGATQPVHPIVRDEIYRLGREAIANAFRHSKADKIEVEIEYAPKYFRFSVSDNGCGIDQEILREGRREGHLGLVGMRECADRIGGKLRIWSREEGGGTEIELIVPGHIAFKKDPSSNFLNRLSNLFQGKTEAQVSAKEHEE